MKKSRSQDLTQGDLKKQFTKLSIPVGAGLFALMLFGIVDSYFISKLGTAPLGAMGLCYPIIMIFIGLFLGLGNGIFAFVSPAIGEKNYKEALKYTTQGSILTVIISSILLLTTFIMQPLIYKIMKVPSDIIIYIYQYMNLWLLAAFFTSIHITWEKTLQSTGDTISPAIAIIFSAITNLLLDPLLIFGYWIFPEMGVSGASLATLIGNIVGFIIIFRKIIQSQLLVFYKNILKDIFKTWKNIIKISLPNIYYPTLLTITIMMLNYMVLEYGNQIIAGIGIGLRIERLVVVTFIAITIAAMSIIGQCIGVKNQFRIIKTLTYATNMYIICFLGSLVIYILFGKRVVGLFSTDAVIVNTGYYFLLITSFAYVGQGIIHLCHAIFNTLKKPLYSYITITIQAFCIILGSYLGLIYFEVKGLLICYSISVLIVSLTQLLIVRKMIKNIFTQ